MGFGGVSEGFFADRDCGRAVGGGAGGVWSGCERNVEGRVRWLELLKAVNGCLPPYERPKPEDPKAPMAARISI